MKKIILFIVIIVSTSCNEIFEDCLLFSAKPNIKTNNVVSGTINTEYHQVIEGEVKNDPNDSNYSYSFNVKNLPEGINYSSRSNTLILEGTPKESGTFTIEVTLKIQSNCHDFDNDEFDCDGICLGNDTDDKKYSLEIKN